MRSRGRSCSGPGNGQAGEQHARSTGRAQFAVSSADGDRAAGETVDEFIGAVFVDVHGDPLQCSGIDNYGVYSNIFRCQLSD